MEGGDEASQTLMGFAGKTFELAMDILKNRPEDKFYTVNHGDCWNNNMLFKKDPETGKIEDHLFIDMQVTLF